MSPQTIEGAPAPGAPQRKFFDVIAEQDAQWSEIVNSCAGADARLVACSASSPNRRIYVSDGKVFKIVREREPEFRNDLVTEFELLREFAGVGYLPRAIEVRTERDYVALVLEQELGEQIGQVGDPLSRKVSLGAIARAYLGLNARGLRHGDATLGNILVEPGGAVRVLDLDQAVKTNPAAAFLGDFLGAGPHPAVRTVPHLLLRLGLGRMKLGGLGRVARRLRRRSAAEDTVPNSRLDEVWEMASMTDANAPGRKVAYYRIAYEGRLMPGERAWEPRWDAIRRAVDFRGKRLLELGCNLGLLSCYARNEAASGCHGVDHEQRIVDAAVNFAKFAEVDTTFSRCDFDSPEPWESELGAENYDIVSALSVVNWLKDRKRFLAFLGRFREVIFEGHDSVGVETDRLRSVGFTRIEIVAVSERGRPLVLASRE